MVCETLCGVPCRHLALSTNNIEKISSLSGMENLRILSLGRNLIKKIENLDAVADTLEELWISYNQIASLVREKEPDSCSRIVRFEHWVSGISWILSMRPGVLFRGKGCKCATSRTARGLISR